MTTNDTVISLKNVSVEFGSSKWFEFQEENIVQAVNNVSIDIGENDVFVLVGESGCGKTTLGKTAIGLQRPTEGEVLYRGQDIWEAKDESDKIINRGTGDVSIPYDEIRRSLQIIHQDPGGSLTANKSIESILAAPLKRWEPDLNKNDRRERIYGLLEFTGLTPPQDFANRFPHQLSGGEQQRVALVRALLMNPDLILADEAISALDVSLRIDMMDLMLNLQDMFNTSYLYITHDLSNARYMAEKGGGRIGIMYLGDLVEVGQSEDIVNDPKHPYTKALLWAAPDFTTLEDLSSISKIEDTPLRAIDIPDAADPPTGCSFHTRCPEAREVCRLEKPDLIEGERGHRAACFREESEHEYWESAELASDSSIESIDSVGKSR